MEKNQKISSLQGDSKTLLKAFRWDAPSLICREILVSRASFIMLGPRWRIDGGG